MHVRLVESIDQGRNMAGADAMVASEYYLGMDSVCYIPK